jgi:hypothetical protein
MELIMCFIGYLNKQCLQMQPAPSHIMFLPVFHFIGVYGAYLLIQSLLTAFIALPLCLLFFASSPSQTADIYRSLFSAGSLPVFPTFLVIFFILTAGFLIIEGRDMACRWRPFQFIPGWQCILC